MALCVLCRKAELEAFEHGVAPSTGEEEEASKREPAKLLIEYGCAPYGYGIDEDASFKKQLG